MHWYLNAAIRTEAEYQAALVRKHTNKSRFFWAYAQDQRKAWLRDQDYRMAHSIAHDALIARGHRRHKAPEGECSYCDKERANNVEFHPSHDASTSCRSGCHNHCTCDSCF